MASKAAVAQRLAGYQPVVGGGGPLQHLVLIFFPLLLLQDKDLFLSQPKIFFTFVLPVFFPGPLEGRMNKQLGGYLSDNQSQRTTAV